MRRRGFGCGLAGEWGVRVNRNAGYRAPMARSRTRLAVMQTLVLLRKELRFDETDDGWGGRRPKS